MLAIALGGPHMRIKSKEGIGTKVKFEILPFEIAWAESNPNIDITYSKSINESAFTYKIFIMDCDMPVMNGWKASNKIHSLFKQSKIKTLPYIIGCTAHLNKDVSSKCSKAGMICQVEKPIVKKIFTNLLKEYML